MGYPYPIPKALDKGIKPQQSHRTVSLFRLKPRPRPVVTTDTRRQRDPKPGNRRSTMNPAIKAAGKGLELHVFHEKDCMGSELKHVEATN